MVTSYCSYRHLVVVFPTPNERVSKYTGHGVLQLALRYLPLSNSFDVQNLNAKTKSVTSVRTVLNASFTSEMPKYRSENGSKRALTRSIFIVNIPALTTLLIV
jgi:hypothetical protein